MIIDKETRYEANLAKLKPEETNKGTCVACNSQRQSQPHGIMLIHGEIRSLVEPFPCNKCLFADQASMLTGNTWINSQRH